MRYFFTARLQKWFGLSLILLMLALGLVTRDILFALLPSVPAMLLLVWLDEFKPPFKGQTRTIRITYYKTQSWDGKEWVDWEEYPPNKAVAV